jgi:2-methylcitrate dehydratase PrpD
MSSGSLKNFCGKPWEIGQFPHGDAAFSYLYTVAVALLNKSVKPGHFSPEAIQDPQIKGIVQKIKMMEWPENGMTGTGLKVIMTDGTEIMETCRIAKGDPANPMSREELMTKFMGNVNYSQKISEAQAKDLLALLENLEELDNMDEIIRLLVV